MNTPDTLLKLSKLHKLSVSAAGTPEGDNATALFKRLVTKSGYDVGPDDFEKIEVAIPMGSMFDGDLLPLVKKAIPVAQVISQPSRNRLLLRGPRIFVREFERVFLSHRNQMALSAFSIAFSHIALYFGPEALQELADTDEKPSRTAPVPGMDPPPADGFSRGEWLDRVPDFDPLEEKKTMEAHIDHQRASAAFAERQPWHHLKKGTP